MPTKHAPTTRPLYLGSLHGDDAHAYASPAFGELRSEGSLEVHPVDHGVRLVSQANVVDVDTSGHSLRVTRPNGEVTHLAALRPALAHVVDIAHAALGTPRRESRTYDQVTEAVYVALRRAAGRAERRAGAAERMVDELRRTPLVYSFPFLAARYLQNDALRFRPCCVAIAFIEDEEGDDLPFPERAEQIVDKLTRWRNLYRGERAAKKAVNRTLDEFGGKVSPYGLWGLRRVPLSAKAASVEHVELLGALGQVGGERAATEEAGLAPAFRLVEQAKRTQIQDAVEWIVRQPFAQPEVVGGASGPGRSDGYHLLAEVLAAFELDEGRPFDKTVRELVEQLEHEWRTGDGAVLPPIPLPEWPGYRFLASKKDIRAEGRQMGHCVAMRAKLALDGRAFFFHVEDGVHRVTVQLDARGKVFEARGPRNEHNALVPVAAARLASWGRGFAMKAAPPRDDTVIWHAGPVLPKGLVPLRTKQAAYVLLDEAHPAFDKDGDQLRRWLRRWLEKAEDGRVVLAHRPTRPVVGYPRLPPIVVFNMKGKQVAHIEESLRSS